MTWSLKLGSIRQKKFEALAPSAYEAAEAKRTHLFQGSDFGGGGIWYLWECRK